MRPSSFTQKVLEELEREIISFIWQESWQQKWRGEDLPKDIFRSFAAHARRISDSFTLGRRQIDLDYLRTKEGRSAYLLYFHLASMVRMLDVLEEIERRGFWPNRPIRVLDLGSGSAPALWAVRFAQKQFGGDLLEAVALDREKAVLPPTKRLWERFLKHLGTSFPELRTIRVDFRDPRTPKTLKRLGTFDLVLCANVLNELGLTIGSRRFPLFRQIWKENVAPEGLMILLEPALQKTSRDLTSFRDQWMSEMEIRAPIPCGHRGRCPLNLEPRDWCHFEVEWSPPPIRRRIEKALEHQSGVLKYSYLVIQHGNGNDAADRYRVISDPLETKSGNLLLLCSPDRKLALKFDRKEGTFSELLRSARRGDLLEVSLAESKEIVPPARHYALEISQERIRSVRKL